MAHGGKEFDLQIKLLTIGNSGVGKTCLLLRYGDDKFSPTFITTIGIDFKVKTITVDDMRVKMQIWDTAGQERFRTITTSYFRGAQGILLVYDVTDRKSFTAISEWMSEIKKLGDKSVNVILIGNKCDRETERLVKMDEGKALAATYGIDFFETSAKKNINVNEAFEAIARQVKNRIGPAGGGGGGRGGGGVDVTTTTSAGGGKKCC